MMMMMMLHPKEEVGTCIRVQSPHVLLACVHVVMMPILQCQKDKKLNGDEDHGGEEEEASLR